MNISKINFTSSYYKNQKEIQIPSWVNERHANIKKSSYNDSGYDLYLPTRNKNNKKKRNNNIPPYYALLAALGLSIATAHSCGRINNKNNEYTVVETTSAPVEAQETLPLEEVDDNVIYITSEEIKEPEIVESPEEAEKSAKVQKLYDFITENDPEATEHFRNMRNSFDLPEKEVLKILIELCESPQFGNGKIPAKVFYAQICQESNWEKDMLGDKKLGEYRAVGLGQMHRGALGDVNEMIKKGYFGNYTYNWGSPYSFKRIDDDNYKSALLNGTDDRYDPVKALETALLYDRYCYNRTYDLDSALAMYNTGSPKGYNSSAGREYVSSIYKHINR